MISSTVVPGVRAGRKGKEGGEILREPIYLLIYFYSHGEMEGKKCVPIVDVFENIRTRGENNERNLSRKL